MGTKWVLPGWVHADIGRLRDGSRMGTSGGGRGRDAGSVAGSLPLPSISAQEKEDFSPPVLFSRRSPNRCCW